MLRGQMDWYRESRFLDELPDSAKDKLAERNVRSPYAAKPKPWTLPEKKNSVQAKKPFLMTEQKAPAVSRELDYEVGDTVRHVKFGQGIVKEIRDGGRDKEVTVEFERFGVKKMFAGFAKLEPAGKDQG
jgi:DNA helicase-2/ATP-dependent DNA helicase PcrA